MATNTRVGGFLVATDGSGPDALFVHGGPGLNDYLAPVSDLLADVVRSHRYTMRGIARSPLDGPFAVAQHIADAVGILDGLGLDRAVLVGREHVDAGRPTSKQSPALRLGPGGAP